VSDLLIFGKRSFIFFCAAADDFCFINAVTGTINRATPPPSLLRRYSSRCGVAWQLVTSLMTMTMTMTRRQGANSGHRVVFPPRSADGQALTSRTDRPGPRSRPAGVLSPV